MNPAVLRLKNSGLAGLLTLLVGTCVLSMGAVACFYHFALGRVARAVTDSAAAAQHGLRISYGLIESLALTHNALQTLLREKDVDVLETLVGDLQVRQRDLSRRIDALGRRALAVKRQFDAWNGACEQIVATFLRGENAEANSQLVNRLMPQSEKVLAEVRRINDENERDAAARTTAAEADIARIRLRAMTAVAVAAAIILLGGLALRRQVARGTGAVADLLSRLTSMREANKVLEERVRERTAAIERSNAEMAAIHRTSLDCVLVLDSEWRIIEFNPAAQRAFGRTRADALRQKLADFVELPGRDDAGAGDARDAARVIGKLIEVTARRPDGMTFPAEIAITAAEMDGPPVYIASLRDLSERKTAEAEREELNRRLLSASRVAGMADVATGVLHNVGNVLNSVNVSASVVTDTLKRSELASLVKVRDLLREHQPDLAAYITTDARGRLLPEFIGDLADCLCDEQAAIQSELTTLAKGVEHIKQIITAQQSLAKKAAVAAPVEPAKLMETALTMQDPSLANDGVEVIRRLADLPVVALDQHKVLQILVNLISNARQSVNASRRPDKRITVALEAEQREDGPGLRFQVIDNGVGVAPENLTRVFSHGFTTKSEGHGFGLHSSANAAREMGGALTLASDGLGRGATFTLLIPVAAEQVVAKCKK